MEHWLKYCLSLVFILSAGFIYINSDSLSNETYHKLDINERRKLSADYLALAKSLETGSPRAMRLLNKAARINPENELVWKELCWPYLYTGQYAKWRQYIDKAIELNPQEWQGNRGYVKLLFLKDYAGALYDIEAHDTIKTEIAYYGRVHSTEYLKGLCYLGLKNHEQATLSFKNYLKSEEKKTGSFEINPMAYIYLAIIDIYNQDYQRAVKQIQPALDEPKPLADAYYHAAYANFMLGQATLANQQVSKAIELYNQDQYNNDRMVEVQEKLYLRDLEALKTEVECFL